MVIRFAALVLLVAVVFGLNVAEHAFIGDDAFISFRYARHLVDGHGLVWNVGERVEGYTNFLWVMLMAGVLAMGGEPVVWSQGLGIAAGSGVLLLVVHHGAGAYGWRSWLVWIAPGLLALHREFAAWCTGGLETQLFALLVIAGLLRLFTELRRDDRPRAGSAVLLGVAVLCRPDGAVFMFAAGLCLLVRVLARSAAGERRAGWPSLVYWSAVALALPLAHLGWRVGYYGEWLPNTFYAKVNGAWWAQAVHFYRHFEADYHWAAFVLVLPLAITGPRAREHAILLVAVLAYGGYVAYVGGDRFGFRLLVPCLPLVTMLWAASVRGLVELVSARTAARRQLSTITGLVLVTLFAGTSHGAWREAATRSRNNIASVEMVGRYAASRVHQGQRLREFVDARRLPADVTIGLGGAGAIPYYTQWKAIDYRGLNDHHVARQPIKQRGKIAHEHEASLTYLHARGVEIFDLANGPVRRRGKGLGKLRKEVAKKAERWNRGTADQGSSVRIYPECRILDDKWVLLVGRISVSRHFEQRFGHLPKCR